MQENMSGIWGRYYQFYKHFYADAHFSKQSGLPRLRDKLFISILLVTLPIGALVYIPSVIVSFKTGAVAVGIFDTLAILLLLYIFFAKNLVIRAKKVLFSLNLYMLATVLLLYLGTMGPGTIALVGISILITLYHGKRVGLYSIGLNAGIYFLLLVILSTHPPDLAFFKDYTPGSWMAVGLNLLAFNTIVVYSVSFLVDHLQASLINEQQLRRKLKKESEKLREAKEKAEESDRLKSLFLANISHEIRTPMNGILGFAELLKTTDPASEKREKFIKTIQESGRRMLGIINDLIDISRLESGHVEVNTSSTGIGEMMEYFYDFFLPEAKGKGLELRYTRTMAEKGPEILTDKEKLYRVLTNLIKNAIKYTAKGKVEFGYEVRNEVVEFFVKDTGPGISKEQQEVVFNRFVQLDRQGQQPVEGAGLGLAITKAYVELLGGEIWLESGIGHGSCFYFTIPNIKPS